jgi:hypothetical protein
MGSAVNSFTEMTSTGGTLGSWAYLAGTLVILAAAIVATAYLLYRMDLGTGAVRRRIKAFEVGWRE